MSIHTRFRTYTPMSWMTGVGSPHVAGEPGRRFCSGYPVAQRLDRYRVVQQPRGRVFRASGPPSANPGSYPTVAG